MTLPAPTYDLMLLLDPQVEQPTRAKIVADTRAAIEAQGELLRHDDWGERPLAYAIERKPAAEYHLLQFRPSTTELLSALNRTLGITDGLMRFRIIKLKPGVPDAPDMRSASPPARQAVPEAEAAPPAPEAAPEAEAAPPAPEAAPEAEAAPPAPEAAPVAAPPAQQSDEAAVAASETV
jgi:small subunit ribosomal protein S6